MSNEGSQKFIDKLKKLKLLAIAAATTIATNAKAEVTSPETSNTKKTTIEQNTVNTFITNVKNNILENGGKEKKGQVVLEKDGNYIKLDESKGSVKLFDASKNEGYIIESVNGTNFGVYACNGNPEYNLCVAATKGKCTAALKFMETFTKGKQQPINFLAMNQNTK